MELKNGPNRPLNFSKKAIQYVELRFLIPRKAAGSVIGKSGENIRNIRRLFCGRINVSNNSGPERVLSLEADIESVLLILSYVLEKIEVAVLPTRSGNGDNNENQHFVDLRMLVHKSLVKVLLEGSGEQINELRKKFNLRLLKVYQIVCPESTDNIIQLVGYIPLVINCIGKIVEICKDTPIREPKCNYNAKNYNNMSSAHYGGWKIIPATKRNPPENKYKTDFPPLGGFIRDTKLRGSKSSYDTDGYDYNPDGHNRNDNNQELKELKLPDKSVGLIIGSGGSRIKQVRRESGAHILISRYQRSDEERQVTIRGNTEQVNKAYEMINDYLKIKI